MLNACHALKNVWHVAMDPFGRLNARLAYSAAEGLISSSPNYPQPKPSLDMKNGQDVCILNSSHHKRRKMAFEVSTTHLDSRWHALDTPDFAANSAVQRSTADSCEEFEEVDPVLLGDLQRHVAHLRRWQWTAMSQQHQACKVGPSGMEFTLMCYNILSQELLEFNSYLYKHCHSSVLNWEYRKRNLLAEIKAANADIICLQEVQEDHYKEVFEPEMKHLGYESLYKKRTGDKNDGCTIFYKTNMFELDCHVDIEYFQPGIPVLDRDNIGMITVLRPHFDPSTKLCVATTHLLFNPRRGDIKLAQLQVLLAELDKVAFKGFSRGKVQYHPCIMCGDMNSEPQSPLYNFLTHGILHYYGIQSGDISGQREGRDRGNMIHRHDILLPELGITTDCQYASELNGRETQSKKAPPSVPVLEHGFRFDSAYSHVHPNGMTEVTTHHTKANCTVDYILFSAQTLRNSPLSLLGTLRLLTDEEVTDIGGLPNLVLSSDHLALVSKFLLKRS